MWLNNAKLFLGITSVIGFSHFASLSSTKSWYFSSPSASAFQTASPTEPSRISVVSRIRRSSLCSINGFPTSSIIHCTY